MPLRPCDRIMRSCFLHRVLGTDAFFARIKQDDDTYNDESDGTSCRCSCYDVHARCACSPKERLSIALICVLERELSYHSTVPQEQAVSYSCPERPSQTTCSGPGVEFRIRVESICKLPNHWSKSC